MNIHGRVHHGVVVLEGGISLPEGACVDISYQRPGPMIHVSSVRRQAQLPIVKSDRPGSLLLTNDQIAEILEEEDIAAMKGMWNVPS